MMRCVPAHDFTVGKAYNWRSAIDENPPYQRESSVWSLEKQQLFIDSLLNGYDVPKIYLHDLRGKHPTKVYTVVDGKQRLTTIWRFLKNELPLAPDFRVEEANLPELPPNVRHPVAGQVYSELDKPWQAVLRSTYLAVVLIQNATPDDIEDLFSRLNNGEPLNQAETRNAMGGELVQLIREVAQRPFFKERVKLSTERYAHYELAARFLQIELHDRDRAEGYPDLRNKPLDNAVRGHRRMGEADKADLMERVDAQLESMERIFEREDPLLATQVYPPLYYLFVKAADREFDHPELPGRVRRFLEWFQHTRLAELDRPEELQDPQLIEFSRLMQQGTMEPSSLERRVEILTAYFREQNPDVPRREELYVSEA
jgi:hypothetical protein